MLTVFIDDVVDAVKFAYTLMFADDIKLAAIIRDFDDTRKMQQDINKVMDWNTANRLHFNDGKCYMFSAYRHHSAFIKADYKMGDHNIDRVEEISDLGVLIDKWFHFGHRLHKTLFEW